MPRQLAGFTEVQVPRTPPLVDVALTFLGAFFIEISCTSYNRKIRCWSWPTVRGILQVQ
jgi:hypothetical protein